MKNYPHIISKLFYEPLLVTPQRHAACCQLLESKLASAITTEAAPADNEHSPRTIRQVAEDAVVINVHGTLVMHPEDIAMSECGCNLQTLSQQIDAVEADPRIKTVFYNFRTPGGAVTGVPEAGRKILAQDPDSNGSLGIAISEAVEVAAQRVHEVSEIAVGQLRQLIAEDRKRRWPGAGLRCIADLDAPAGSAVEYHLHNHGYNTWTLLQLEVER